ncbi:MAG TPA: thiopurine S-methyltransferase, partial [Chthoniobacteraceae bacterium]
MATDWESHYQQGDTPWEKGGPSPGLVDFLAAEPVTGRVLVPGCGFGHDVRALSAGGADVLGVDLSPS